MAVKNMFDYVRSVPVILPGESRRKQTEKYREARDNFDAQLAIIQVLMNITLDKQSQVFLGSSGGFVDC